MMPTLISAYVFPFYRVNSGFFLFLFLLLFGIVDPGAALRFHYSVMEEAAHSYSILGVLQIIWLAYGLKCISFTLQRTGEPSYLFMTELQAAPPIRQWQSLLLCHALLFLPALAYGIMTAWVAAAAGNAFGSIAVIFFLVLMIALASALQLSALAGYRQRPWQRWLSRSRWGRGRNRPLNLVLINYSLSAQKKTLFLLKTFSLLLLQAMVAFNKGTASKESVCFFMMLIVACHALLPYQYVRFTEQRLPWMRNLPLPLLRRFGIYVLSYALLLLPELCFLILHVHDTLPVLLIVALCFTSVALLSFYTSLLYLPGMLVDRYMLWVLAVFLIGMLLLAAMPLGLFGATVLLLSLGIFRLRYERFEWPAAE